MHLVLHFACHCDAIPCSSLRRHLVRSARTARKQATMPRPPHCSAAGAGAATRHASGGHCRCRCWAATHTSCKSRPRPASKHRPRCARRLWRDCLKRLPDSGSSASAKTLPECTLERCYSSTDNVCARAGAAGVQGRWVVARGLARESLRAGVRVRRARQGGRRCSRQSAAARPAHRRRGACFLCTAANATGARASERTSTWGRCVHEACEAADATPGVQVQGACAGRTEQTCTHRHSPATLCSRRRQPRLASIRARRRCRGRWSALHAPTCSSGAFVTASVRRDASDAAAAACASVRSRARHVTRQRPEAAVGHAARAACRRERPRAVWSASVHVACGRLRRCNAWRRGAQRCAAEDAQAPTRWTHRTHGSIAAAARASACRRVASQPPRTQPAHAGHSSCYAAGIGASVNSKHARAAKGASAGHGSERAQTHVLRPTCGPALDRGAEE
jgi:hypothetical protein